ncbi:MAG TPA: SUMF1/EgtB/PvdO family nonheme iron enzyme [Anaerolineae bacterium]|nr:SUMF1/EgtB/PvdO family nonheme iron enzyme [Anaerolineae bacterium]
MKTCPQCNTQLPDEARFCLACGAAQSGAATSAAVRDGAIAQGAGATALGAGAVQAHDVGGDVVTGTKTETHYHGTTGPDPAELEAAYLHHLLETAGQLSLSGIDPKVASEAEARLELSAVYTALLTLTPEECERLNTKRDCPPEALERGAGKRLSVVAQLERHPRLVLLGEPGSGKSTFVSFVALCLAGERLGRADINLGRLTEPLPREENDTRNPAPQPWTHGALLPVRVVLRDFAARGLPPAGERATAKHLWDFIVAELEAAALDAYAPHLAQTLQREGGLLLLDGLDEVPEAARRREQLKQAVEDFAATFRKVRVLVTSRTYAYQQQEWRLRDFAEAVLAPFTPGQIAHFVARWYQYIARLRGLHSADAEGRAELLRRAIFASDRLQALAERPLLLTLMASLHAWRGGSLPEKREELYADTVDLLLDWWERPKVVREKDQVIVQQPSLAEWLKIERDAVRTLLEQLAFAAHAGQPDLVGTADIPEGDLLSGLLRLSRNPEVKPARLVEYLSQRAGLLLPRGEGVYTFPHRTFQEYLAACHLTDHEYPDKVAELARDEPNRWREAALLAGAKAARGTASAVWSLVEALCYKDFAPGATLPEADAYGALLAGQALVENAALGEISPRNQPKARRVQVHLARLLETGGLNAVERVQAGVLLAHLGDPRPGVGLGVNGLPALVWCEIPAGLFLMGSSDDDENAWGDEKPQHTVKIPMSYYISRYPVTQTQYAAFVKAGGYTERRYWTDAGWQRKEREDWAGPECYGTPFDLPNHPVVGVSWYEAVAFCRWLEEQLKAVNSKFQVWKADQLTTISVSPGAFNVRLPGEPEWEKAARGEDGRRYPWGNDMDAEQVNYEGTGIGATSAVGAFPGGASLYGVLDLSGNVWEWCRTKWEGNYRQYQNDVDPAGDARRVVRGGAFGSNDWGVRCAYRNCGLPYDRSGGQGFRVVLSLSTPDSVSLDSDALGL